MNDPAWGIVIRKSVAMNGSMPIITNSVTPSPNVPKANAVSDFFIIVSLRFLCVSVIVKCMCFSVCDVIVPFLRCNSATFTMRFGHYYHVKVSKLQRHINEGELLSQPIEEANGTHSMIS